MKKIFILLWLTSVSASSIWAQSQLNFTIPDCPSPTGISKTLSERNISVYPNPATQDVFVSLKNTSLEQSNLRIEIYNNLGAVIWSKEVLYKETVILPMSEFSSGIYLLNITNGTEAVRSKIIKQ